GLPIVYSLTAKPEKVSLKVVDISGKTLREFKAPMTTGLHKVAWDLTQGPTVPGGGKKGGMGMGGGGKKGGGPGGPGAVRALDACGARPNGVSGSCVPKQSLGTRKIAGVHCSGPVTGGFP